MKPNTDVLMIILLVALIASFVTLIIYGEVWRINLSMQGTQIESLDRGQAQIAFISAVVCVASGASMLYIMSTKFSQEVKKEGPASAFSKAEELRNPPASTASR